MSTVLPKSTHLVSNRTEAMTKSHVTAVASAKISRIFVQVS
jgi:hypothetical protein